MAGGPDEQSFLLTKIRQINQQPLLPMIVILHTYTYIMLVDLLFVAAVVGLLIAIYKIKFSKENINREIE